MMSSIINNKIAFCEHKTGVFCFNVLQLLNKLLHICSTLYFTVTCVVSCYTAVQLCACYCVVKSNPITGLDRPLGFQKVEAPRFLDNRHMKVVRLSALRTGHLYHPGKIPGTQFC
jgi:hypothetical protein